MTITRVDRNTASEMECVTKIVVRLRSLDSVSRSSSSRLRVNSSSAPNGSSINSRSGLVTSARAIDTRMRMPPDSWRGMAFARPSNSTCASAGATRALASCRGDTREIEREPHVARDIGPRHQRGFLEHEGQPPSVAADIVEAAAPP